MPAQKPRRKSPLEMPPLRNPGQSLDDQINRVYDDKVSTDALYIVSIMLFIFLYWWNYFIPSRANPFAVTAIGLMVMLIFGNRLRKSKKQIMMLKLGRDGERWVGQSLEELRSLGFGVLHDISGGSFNLDHIIFSRNGIYVVETKTYSKPVKGAAEITFDGTKLLANGRAPARDPIVQVKAEVNWLRKLLEASTGKKYPVKGIVVFPGWFVHPMPSAVKEEAWVLNPKALASFISNEPVRLKDDEVAMAIYHLACYVRMKS